MRDAPRSEAVLDPPPLSGAPLFLLTVAIAAATAMEILDMTIVNVSIPSISGSLGVSTTEGSWTISSYQLASAVMQPLTGWIGRRFGEVRTFLYSIILFMVFSALCGFAVSMPMLVFSRLMQGLVAGPIMALGQALLLRNYPIRKRGVALGLWGMVVIIAPIFGPILGGLITDNYSWPWLFYINIPVGLAAAAIVAATLKNRDSKRVKLPIDVVGLTLLVVGVGSLQYMLDNGNDLDWFGSPIIVAAAVVSVVSLTFLIPWELTDLHPIVDLHFFQRRNFRIGAISLSLAYFAFMGSTIIFPLWLQTTMGYTATWAGLAVAPGGLLALVISPVFGRNIHRANLRFTASFAFAAFAATSFWMGHMNQTATLFQMAMPRFWQGIGISFFFLSLNQITLSSVKTDELASATGLSNFMRTMAGSLATAVSIWLWNRRTDFHHAVLTEHIRDAAYGWTKMQTQLEPLGMTGASALQYTDRILTEQAMTLAANDLFYLFSAIFVLIIPVIWLARPPFGARTAEAAH